MAKKGNIFVRLENCNCRSDYISFIKKETYINCGEIDSISRPEHICAVYCLGKNLIEKMYKGIFIPVNEELEGIVYINFNEIWTYIALFHDIGYGYQNYYAPDKYNPNYIDSIYRGYVIDVCEKINDEWATHYNVDELLAYYSYLYQKRVNENIEKRKKINSEVHEHGILGGALASEIMKENQPEIKKDKNNTWYDIRLATALSIAQHNIWPVSKTDLKKYYCCFNSYNVNKKKFLAKQHKFDKTIDLLSFFLCLVDSIDITKRLTDNEPFDYGLINTILKKYKINVAKQKNLTSLRIYGRAIKNVLVKKGNVEIFDKWVSSIENMSSFLNVTVVPHKQDYYDIKIETN